MTTTDRVDPATHDELTTRTRNVVMSLKGPASLPFLHDDLVIIEPDFLPYGGTHHGLDGFQTVMAAATQIIDLSLTTFEGVVADGEHAVRFIRATLRRTGEQVTIAEELQLRDGKVASIRVFWFEHGAP